MSAFKECPGGSNVLPVPREPVAELEEIRELTCFGGDPGCAPYQPYATQQAT